MRNYFVNKDGILEVVDYNNDLARCLYPLLDSLGMYGDISGALADALPHNVSKLTLNELFNVMANLKYRSFVEKRRLGQIDSNEAPVLFLPKKGAAMTIIRRVGDTFLVFDGGTGEYTERVADSTPGMIVRFTPVDETTEGLTGQVDDWFYKLMARFKPAYGYVALLTFAISMAVFSYPLIIMTVYEKIVVSDSVDNTQTLFIGALLAITAHVLLTFTRAQYINVFSVRLGNIIGTQVMRRLLYLPPGFTDVATAGDQLSRIRDYENLREFFAGRGALAVIELVFVILLVFCMYLIGGVLVAVPIVAILLFFLMGSIISPFLRRANERLGKVSAKRQRFLTEMVQDVRAIKCDKASELWLKRYEEIGAEAASAYVGSASLMGAMQAFAQVLTNGAAVAVLGFGSLLVLQGEIVPGALIASLFLIWRILSPLNTVYSVFTQFSQIKKSIAQLDRLMNLRISERLRKGLERDEPFDGRVEFSAVSLRYSQETLPALLGVTFTVEPHTVVALLGHTGSGKSSILKCILGMYNPQGGRVFIDNMNVLQINPTNLRKLIAYAPKEDFFVQGTIAQNLLLIKPSATESELHAAARMAGVLDDILAMPGGFSMKMKDNNLNRFSVSFRKRLSLARVFLKGSSVILLDHPEGGLTDMESKVLAANLATLRGSATIFMVTESEEMLAIANTAILLDKGKLVRMGPSHEVGKTYFRNLSAKRLDESVSGSAQPKNSVRQG